MRQYETTVRDARLDQTSLLRRLLWVVLLCTFVLTVTVTAYARDALRERNRQRFDRRVEQIVGQLDETLEHNARMLRASAGFIEASGDDEAGWRTFSDALALQERYPELSALAVVRYVSADALADFTATQRDRHPGYSMRPAYDGPYHLPIVLAAPLLSSAGLRGYDVAHEKRRRDAIEQAFRTGSVRVTAPVDPSSENSSGIVMVAPFKRVPRSGSGLHENGYQGAIVTSMLLERMLDGPQSTDKREVRLRVSDGNERLYDELDSSVDPQVDPRPLFTDTRRLQVFGRVWRIDIETTRGFRATAGIATPWLLLGAGLCINALLMALLLLHARGSRRLLYAARSLRDERMALANSNERLETFACVVSHDLKSPLQGISMLVNLCEEDIREACPDLDSDLFDHFLRMRRQIDQAYALIEDLLEYSGLDNQVQANIEVDLRAMINEIGDSLCAGPDRLLIEGELPVLSTDAVRLRQVLANLIGNAFKYHETPGEARVRVSADTVGDWLNVSITDNGPGIDPAQRERIFDPFVTAHGTKRSDSTGVGLAIVRKGIESMGGTIQVRAAHDTQTGTVFAFSWPLHPASTDLDEAAEGDDPPLPLQRTA